MKRLIVGMGVTGRAVAAFLGNRGEPFETFDDGRAGDAINAGKRFLSPCHHCNPETIDMDRFGEVVVSPGIPPAHPVLVMAREKGISTVGEIELAFRHCPGKLIAVTGSNGKSTTVSLIHHLIQSAGIKSSLCGNIGTPFIEALDQDPNHYYVIEVSSFQLTTIDRFAPQIAVLLNLSPDHLDWHGSYDAYRIAKLRLFENQKPEHLAILTSQDVGEIPGLGRRVLVPGVNVDMGPEGLNIGGDFQLKWDLVRLLGNHNRENILFACLVCRELGISAAQVAESLPDFRGLEHRMEWVGELEGRLWINDSKATNLHASQAAVSAMDRPYVLIMGGCGKGDRFSQLNLAVNPPLAIIAYGETAEKICEDLADFDPIKIPGFEDACRTAHHLAGVGDAVLLAPACASFDQFTNFGERGRAFKHLFRTMAHSL